MVALFFQAQRRPVREAGLAFLVVCSVQALLVKYFGSELPFWDEWNSTLPILVADSAGTLTWAALWAQYVENRMLLPRLVFVLLYRLFGAWSPVSQMLFSALLVGTLAACWVYSLARLELPRWLACVSCALLVSPVQWENIVWGLQLQYYLLLLCVIGGICAVTLRKGVDWLAIGMATLACVVATLTVLAGWVSWVALGASLLVSALLADGWRALLRGTLWLRFGVFGAVGLLLAGLYFWDYTFVEQRPASLGDSVAWVLTALQFPAAQRVSLSDTLDARVFLLQWLLIGFAAVLALRHNTRHAILLVGGAVFVLCWLLAAASARAVTPGVAPRYASMLLWGNLLALISATLLAQQAAALPPVARHATRLLLALGCSGLLLLHLQRAETGLALLEIERERRNNWLVQLNEYIHNTDPARALVEPLPFPDAGVLAQMLQHTARVAVLPPALRVPPLKQMPASTSGEGWTFGTAPPETLPRGRNDTWGSWQAGERAGEVRVGPLLVEAPVLIVPVAGLPTRPGSSLALEAIGSAPTRIVYGGADPYVRWAEWQIDVSALQGQQVYLVARDAPARDNGWLAFGAPQPASRTLAGLRWVLARLEVLLGGAAVVWLAAQLLRGYGRYGNST